MKRTSRIEVYEAGDGWRWRLIAANRRIVADSGEAYDTERGALRAAHRLPELAIEAFVAVDEPAAEEPPVHTIIINNPEPVAVRRRWWAR